MRFSVRMLPAACYGCVIAGQRPDYVIAGANSHKTLPTDLLGAGMVAKPGSDLESEGFDLAGFASRVVLPEEVKGFKVEAFLQGLGYRVLQHPWQQDLEVWLPPGFSESGGQAAVQVAEGLAADAVLAKPWERDSSGVRGSGVSGRLHWWCLWLC